MSNRPLTPLGQSSAGQGKGLNCHPFPWTPSRSQNLRKEPQLALFPPGSFFDEKML